MLETVLNLARTRLNDAIAAIGGDILTDTQPFTATMVNGAYRRLQAFLSNLGYSKYKRKFIAFALPACDSQDPSTFQIWSWTQFVNCSGAVFVPPTVTTFPQDFIAPLVIKQRQAGSLQPFWPQWGIAYASDGLCEGMKRPWNWQWEWKNDGVYFPGATMSLDFEVEYAAYDYDFLVTNNVLGNGVNIFPSNMPVPIMRSESALANFICVECCSGRDDVDVSGFIGEAEKDSRLIMNNSDVKLKQRHPVQRRGYSGRNWNYGQSWGNQGY